MTSNVILYNVEFTPALNAAVDNIKDYLKNTPSVEISKQFQYIKHALDLTIKINMMQDNINNFQYNYVSIKNENDTRSYYYFILDANWKGVSTIELILTMDTVNTFNDLLELDIRTNVIREHRDRFKQPEGGLIAEAFTAQDEIDQTEEGIAPILFNSGEKETILDSTNKNAWYLIYNTDKNVSTNPDEIVPISCYLCADSQLTIETEHAPVYITIGDMPVDSSRGLSQYVFTDKDNLNCTLEVNSQVITITQGYSVIITNGTQNLSVELVENKKTKLVKKLLTTTVKLLKMNRAAVGWSESLATINFESLDHPYAWYNTILAWGNFKIFNAGAYYVNITSIKDIDRTLSTIVKIIELPYAPITFIESPSGDYSLPEGWAISYDILGKSQINPILKLKDLTQEFSNLIIENIDLNLTTYIDNLINRVKARKNSIYETKLNNSNYGGWKYVYDTFSKTIKLENIKWLEQDKTIPSLNILFKPTNSMTSNLLFDFQVNDAFTYDATEDYPGILLANRNNEYPVYNSSYLNYLRTGYQYDLQRNANAAGDRWRSFSFGALSTAAAAGASLLPGGQMIGAGAALVLGVNTLKSIADNIDASQQADQQVKQALDNASQQAANIQASGDLNLFRYYNGNKLEKIYYGLSNKMQTNIYDLFYYTGYATNVKKKPNLTSRRSFNFLQAEPVFVNENNLELKKYLQDIKTRYRAGITFFHKFNNGTNNIYDFKQYYENWETWICPRLN